MLETTYRTARRIAVGVIGSTVVVVGVLMLVLPGPGIVVILCGLAILGLEFAFARRWLRTLRERSQAVYEEVVSGEGSNQNSISSVSTSKRAQ